MQPTKNYYHNNYSKNNNNNRVMQNINNNNNTNHRQQPSRKMQIEDQYINNNNNNNRYQKYQKHSKHNNNNNNKNNNNNNNKTPRKQRAQRQININITAQQYTSLHIKHLGNHSIWKKTTFQNRYNDQRLQLINPNYFINKHVLDIGCNQGFIDIEIAMRFFPKQIYAIDIDHKLIKNAKKTLYGIIKRDVKYQQLINDMIEKRENPMQLGEKEYQQQLKQFQYHLSNLYPFRSQKQEEKLQLKQQKQQQKVHDQTASNNDNNKKEIICKKIQDLPLFFQDRIKESFSIEHYLPNNVKVFVQQMFKPQNRFPLNIKFQADNIYTIKYQQDKLYYDTILCLKVTKWIHLTFGDQGIRKLFQKIYDLLRLDGILILQAQDWQSYKRKKNMYPIYRQNYERICYGPNDFEQMLVNDPLRDFKFQLVQRIDHNQRRPNSNSNNNKIDYPILIFKKKSTMLYY